MTPITANIFIFEIGQNLYWMYRDGAKDGIYMNLDGEIAPDPHKTH